MKNMLIAAGLVGAAIAGLILYAQRGSKALPSYGQNALGAPRGTHVMG
jgi:multisubunit Na+/H+ antiporter MnhB subunit